MASFNKITLLGYVGGSPRINEYDGMKVANFSLATTEKIKGEDHTEWFNVSFWRNTAEVIEKYVDKGTQVYVEGRLRTRTYTRQDGTTGTSLEVLGQTLQLLGKSVDGNAGASYAPQSSTNQTSNNNVSEPAPENSAEDDLPF